MVTSDYPALCFTAPFPFDRVSVPLSLASFFWFCFVFTTSPFRAKCYSWFIFTTPVCLLICEIPCDIFSPPATSLIKFPEIALRLSTTPCCRRLTTPPGAHARSSLSALSFPLFSLHWRLQSVLIYNADSLDPTLKGSDSTDSLACSPGTGTFCQVLRNFWGKSFLQLLVEKECIQNFLLCPNITCISLLLWI